MAAAAVRGSKRSYFFDDEGPFPSQPVSKRVRCVSPVRISQRSIIIDELKSTFPHIDPKLLEQTLQDCNNNQNATIERLASLSQKDSNTNNKDADWVEFIVKETISASSVDDAKARASRAVEILKKTIATRAWEDAARACEEAAKSFGEENVKMKERMEVLEKENAVLKRAVAIQHERGRKEMEYKEREVQQRNQLVSEYQEKVRRLEVNNYALTMHLNQALHGSSVLGRCSTYGF